MVEVISLSESERSDLLAGCGEVNELLTWLDALDSRPGLKDLAQRLESIQIHPDSVRNHIGYAEAGYRRNIIKKTENYEMVLIAWKAGQDTPIHDHVGSDCAFHIIEGESTETVYELNDSGLAVPVEQRIYLPGTVCAASEPDIHRISNDTDGNLINLHIYCPPLKGFGIYQAA